MAVYPVPYPRPVFVPSPPARRQRRNERTSRAGGAVRGRPARTIDVRRRPGAVRATFAITPLAAVIGLTVLAAAVVVGLVRAVAIVPSVDGVTQPRRRHASRARVGRAGQRVGLGLALIVVLFSIGLIYVDRSVQISARSYDLAALEAEHDELVRQQRSLENDLARLGSEVAVGHEALDQGLVRLGPPILVPAR